MKRPIKTQNSVEQYFTHELHCNCPNNMPIASDGCSCRIAKDVKAYRNGTYEKPFNIGLIYPKL